MFEEKVIQWYLEFCCSWILLFVCYIEGGKLPGFVMGYLTSVASLQVSVGIMTSLCGVISALLYIVLFNWIVSEIYSLDLWIIIFIITEFIQ